MGIVCCKLHVEDGKQEDEDGDWDDGWTAMNDSGNRELTGSVLLLL